MTFILVWMLLVVGGDLRFQLSSKCSVTFGYKIWWFPVWFLLSSRVGNPDVCPVMLGTCQLDGCVMRTKMWWPSWRAVNWIQASDCFNCDECRATCCWFARETYHSRCVIGWNWWPTGWDTLSAESGATQSKLRGGPVWFLSLTKKEVWFIYVRCPIKACVCGT